MYRREGVSLRDCAFSGGYLLKQDAVHRQSPPLEYHGTCQKFLEAFNNVRLPAWAPFLSNHTLYLSSGLQFDFRILRLCTVP